MNTQREIPVYLFTGFFEAGKTKVIQSTMEDASFNGGERTLILACEEGMEELDISSFASDNAVLRIIESEEQLTKEYLSELSTECDAERVMLEYNGMWMLDQLYNAFPENWMVYQELLIADATTFENYNKNIRSLVVDKLKSCELVVFNRFDKDGPTDQMTLHKIVRGVSRACGIIYEDRTGGVEFDEIEDPLPFDINADIVTVEDKDFAYFYRDMSEELPKYVGKTVRFTGIIGRDDKIGPNAFVIGRRMMICCQDDIAYRGIVATDSKKITLESGTWVRVTGQIQIERHPIYQGEGPVMHLIRYEKTAPPAEPIATFN